MAVLQITIRNRQIVAIGVEEFGVSLPNDKEFTARIHLEPILLELFEKATWPPAQERALATLEGAHLACCQACDFSKALPYRCMHYQHSRARILGEEHNDG